MLHERASGDGDGGARGIALRKGLTQLATLLCVQSAAETPLIEQTRSARLIRTRRCGRTHVFLPRPELCVGIGVTNREGGSPFSKAHLRLRSSVAVHSSNTDLYGRARFFAKVSFNAVRVRSTFRNLAPFPNHVLAYFRKLLFPLNVDKLSKFSLSFFATFYHSFSNHIRAFFLENSKRSNFGYIFTHNLA